MAVAPPAAAEPQLDDAAKASLARLVAHFLLHEIDEPGLRTLRQPAMLAVFDKLQPGCREYLSRDWRGEDFEAAAADYCSLFVLPGGAPPFASAWLGGVPQEHGPRLLARIRLAARRLGVEAGYANLPADHLGILLTLLAEAWQQGDPDAVRELDGELLSRVAGAFAAAAKGRTRNPLYRAVASLLGQLLPAAA